MNKQEVINLMKTSKSKEEWNDNCNKVKKSFGGYPDFWHAEILASGIADRTLKGLGSSAGIKFTVMGEDSQSG